MKTILHIIFCFAYYLGTTQQTAPISKLSSNIKKASFEKITFNYPINPSYHTYIYSTPNESSKTSHRIGDHVNNYLKAIATNSHWIQIKYLDEDIVMTGYVRKQDVFIKDFYVPSLLSVQINPVYWKEYNKHFMCSLVDYDTKKTIDTLSLVNFYHGERFEDINYRSALKGVKSIFRFQTFRESCPGLTENNYIVVNEQNKLSNAFQDVSTGEAGEYFEEKIYQPIMFGDSSIKLVHFGYEADIINHENGTIDELINPKKYKIPLNELVIKQVNVGEPIIEDDEYVMDENEQYKVKETTSFEVYRWDGEKLNKVSKK